MSKQYNLKLVFVTNTGNEQKFLYDDVKRYQTFTSDHNWKNIQVTTADGVFSFFENDTFKLIRLEKTFK